MGLVNAILVFEVTKEHVLNMSQEQDISAL